MKDYKTEQIRSEVYKALAQISFEHDASKEDIDKALEWFNDKFYEYDE